MKPFFSVVIPTYNRASKLKKTLDSIIAQSCNDFEVLIMDDGSMDETKSIVDSFHDVRFRYEWDANSGGPATPRNRGINLARADWICFLDADDIWYPNKLAKVMEVINSSGMRDVVCHNEMMSIISKNSKSLLRYGPYEPDFYRLLLFFGNRLSTSATTVSRRFLNQHDLRFNQSRDYVIVEDYDLWLRIALHGGIFQFIEEPLGEYIIEDDNISSDVMKTRRNHSRLLRNHVFNLQTFESNKDFLWREISLGLFLSQAKSEFMNKNYSTACKLTIKALRISIASSIKHILVKLKKR